MLEKGIPAIYNKLALVNGELKVVASEVPIQEVFNCGDLQADKLVFNFESRFEPYQMYSFDTIDGIDLIIKDIYGGFLAPLEVKLTVLPTSGTAHL